MTLGEVSRYCDGFQFRSKIKRQESASIAYTTSQLICKGISVIFSGKGEIPAIEEVFPSVFDRKELQQQREEAQAQASAARFRAFADAFNSKLTNKEGQNG